MNNTKNDVVEPGILTANTYFWSSGGNASSRRRNEERHQAAVADFFEKIGFIVHRSGDAVIARRDDVEAVFHYSESCKNVYKRLAVRRGEKKTNITTIRKIAAAMN